MNTARPRTENLLDESDILDSHVRDRNDIISVLARLHTAGTLVNVQVENSNRQYNSAFIAINPESNTLELDELVPAKANQNIRSGTAIAIESKLNGVTVWFRTRISAIDNTGHICRYVATLPDSIHYQERRDNFRYQLGSSGVIHLRSQHPVTGVNLFGSLMDISPSGCSFKLSGNQLELDRGVTLRPVTLVFPDDTCIHTNLCIENKITTRQTRSTRYGGEFQFRDNDQKKRVSQLVLSLQRKQPRR